MLVLGDTSSLMTLEMEQNTNGFELCASQIIRANQRTTDDCGGQDGLRLRARLHYALKGSLGDEVPIGV